MVRLKLQADTQKVDQKVEATFKKTIYAMAYKMALKQQEKMRVRQQASSILRIRNFDFIPSSKKTSKA